MVTFRLESVHGGGALEFRGAIPRGLDGYDGTTFIAALVGRPVTAAVDVYDIQPQGWSAFFRDLAEHWRGWSGAREHGSLEGHLQVTCTRDTAGHIELRVRLRGDMGGADWRAEDTIYLEAGQLERIARDATAYFG
jgi:hypothetical protein